MTVNRLVDGNGEIWRIEMKVGKSGNPDLEYKWLCTVMEVFELFCRKQADYSSNNIAKHGEVGVLVRSDDKMARLKNLLLSKEETANEALLDTWLDIVGYGIIGTMCHRGQWPKFEESELWTATKKVVDRDGQDH